MRHQLVHRTLHNMLGVLHRILLTPRLVELLNNRAAHHQHQRHLLGMLPGLQGISGYLNI